MEHVETVIVGGGQNGLALSYQLTRAGREHVVLERGRLVERWHSERWDSLTLLTPNWGTRLPGWHYQGPDPDGYMARDEVVRFFDDYAASFRAPVRTGVTVTAVRATDGPGRYTVETDQGSFRAQNVVVATGSFTKPHLPSFAEELPSDLLQVASNRYRNPAQLPPGSVLVVGSGSSGFQIAEELLDQGRRVYFSLGRQNRLPRRYRGKDIMYWGYVTGLWEQPLDDAPPDRILALPAPALTGVRGGHDLDPRQLALDGAVLLGRLAGVSDGKLLVIPDLRESLAGGEAGQKKAKDGIDTFIKTSGLEVPADPERESLPQPPEETNPIEHVSLRDANLTSVVWATGFTPEFGWLQVPVLDQGKPVHRRGVSAAPGLYFLGVPPIYRRKSLFIDGAEEDAGYLAEQIEAAA